MTGEWKTVGWQGVRPTFTWQDEAWKVYTESFTEMGRQVGKSMAAMTSAMEGAASAVRGFAADLEAETAIGGGVDWGTIDAKLRADPAIVRLAGELRAWWGEERQAGVGMSGTGPGRKKSVPVARKDRKVRTGASAYGWAPVETPSGQVLVKASRGPQTPIPENVLEAERLVKKEVERMKAVLKAEADLGHLGPVTGPKIALAGGGESENTVVLVMDYECEACGAVTGDEELFRELGCAGAV